MATDALIAVVPVPALRIRRTEPLAVFKVRDRWLAVCREHGRRVGNDYPTQLAAFQAALTHCEAYR